MGNAINQREKDNVSSLRGGWHGLKRRRLCFGVSLQASLGLRYGLQEEEQKSLCKYILRDANKSKVSLRGTDWDRRRGLRRTRSCVGGGVQNEKSWPMKKQRWAREGAGSAPCVGFSCTVDRPEANLFGAVITPGI